MFAVIAILCLIALIVVPVALSIGAIGYFIESLRKACGIAMFILGSIVCITIVGVLIGIPLIYIGVCMIKNKLIFFE